jgi:hypothetical protein
MEAKDAYGAAIPLAASMIFAVCSPQEIESSVNPGTYKVPASTPIPPCKRSKGSPRPSRVYASLLSPFELPDVQGRIEHMSVDEKGQR